MIKRLIRIIIVGLLFLGVLWIGGYNWVSFKSAIGFKDPAQTYQPLIESLDNHIDLPDVPTDDGSSIDDVSFTTEETTISGSSGDTDITTSDNDEITTENPINITTEEDQDIAKAEMQTTISINGHTFDMSNHTTISLLDWLTINYSTNAEIAINHKTDSTTTSTSTTTEVTTETTTVATDDVKYNDILANKDDLNTLIASIKTVDKLPKYDDYDRTTYEKPVQSYKLNGHKVNRNDYAWKTSEWFDSDKFTYTCPYTGTVFKDADDGKEDYDFSNLDYDHIVPLKSTYLRGAKEWSTEKQNEYAYNQWVGVDVLNSANRSKSDKGPAEYLPDINIEDYCYSWLLICSKYDLCMTKEEIEICRTNIEIALDNGDEVKHMGGSYEQNE